MKPTSHSSHEVAPAAPWYLPSSHAEHSSLRASAVNVPGPQATASVAPAKQKDPAGQSVHWSLLLSPKVLPNEPLGQGSAADAPRAQYEPTVHEMHAVASVELM